MAARAAQSFTGWLKEQVDRQDPVGDLARDFSTDTSQATTVSGVRRHMNQLGCSDLAERALDRAATEWMAL